MNLTKKFLNFILRKDKREKDIDRLRKAGMKIGQDTTFYPEFWNNAEPYLIEIGSNCQITKGVKAYTHGGAQIARKQYPKFDFFGKVKIGNYVYIGNDSLIMPGVTIGSNCIIAAGSVVTKSIPDGYVIGGNPAKIICKSEEFIKRNIPFNTNTKGMSKKKKKNILLQLPEEKFVIKPYIQEKTNIT